MELEGIYLPQRARRLSRPVIMWRIPAGFPSPAEDYGIRVKCCGNRIGASLLSEHFC